MALTPAQISSYIVKAQRAQEAGMLTIVDGKRSGKKGNSLYYPMRFLSAGVDVLNSNHGLTNLQVEVIIQEMIEQGNLNDFSGDPIPYLTNYIISPSSLGIRITNLIDGPNTGGPLTSWAGYILQVKSDGSAWQFVPSTTLSITAKEGLVALGGGGQSGATLCTSWYNFFDTVATLNDSGVASFAIPNTYQYIQNNGANAMNFYPQLGDNFIGLAVNVPISIAVGGQLTIVCATTKTWRYF